MSILQHQPQHVPTTSQSVEFGVLITLKDGTEKFVTPPMGTDEKDAHDLARLLRHCQDVAGVRVVGVLNYEATPVVSQGFAVTELEPRQGVRRAVKLEGPDGSQEVVSQIADGHVACSCDRWNPQGCEHTRAVRLTPSHRSTGDLARNNPEAFAAAEEEYANSWPPSWAPQSDEEMDAMAAFYHAS